MPVAQAAGTGVGFTSTSAG